MIKKVIGTIGEKLAQRFLIQNKYIILETNYKTHFGEIDIIAKQKIYNAKYIIVFIEVKSRSSYKFGEPCEAVGKLKQHKIIQVANLYLLRNKLENCICRFDVLEVLDDKINHIKDAFVSS